MTNLDATIQMASELAIEEDAIQIVGRIGYEWAIAHEEDCGRIGQMAGTTYRVDASGIIEE